MAAHLSKRRKLASSQVGQDLITPRTAPNGESNEPPQKAFNTIHTEAQFQTSRAGPDQENYVHETSSFYTESAQHTNLFKLKIDELLGHVRPGPDRKEKADNALREIRRVIESIPNRSALSMSEAAQLQDEVNTVPVPYPEPLPDKDLKSKLIYSKPSGIYVVGSHARRSALVAGKQLTIDLAVEMPSHIFQEKDFLNYRYFYKRAYYLSCIATGIQHDLGSQFRLQFMCQNDCILQPAIIIIPNATADKKGSIPPKYQIRIILAASATTFPLNKTLPSKNCIRTRHSSQNSIHTEEATPFYNSILRSECSTLVFEKFLYDSSLRSGAFNDACVLGSIWLGQRGFGSNLSSGGFGHFEWACSMALLLYGGGENGRAVLSEGYSSYQLFKDLLQYFASKDLRKCPTFIFSNPFHVDTKQTPLLFDGARGLNVLFKMSTWSYSSLMHAASTTLKLLADPIEDHFESCFIKKLDAPICKFDYLVRLAVGHVDPLGDSQSDATDGLTRLCHQIYKIFSKGLGDRAILIELKHCGIKPWDINASRLQDKDSEEIQIGLLVNPDSVDRSVEKGPPAEDKEKATNFRQFWGEKSELRQFKDGGILESIIWSSSRANNSVLSEIINHLIRRHLDKVVRYIDILGGNGGLPSIILPSSQPSLVLSETLEKQIRGLETLPLRIRQISAADFKVRYEATQASSADTSKNQTDPARIIVQFEGSKRWPDDFSAVQRTKIAFLLKMGEDLENSCSDLVTKVGLENTLDVLSNIAFLDVTYYDGTAFRIRIYHEREQAMIEHGFENTSQATIERKEAGSALSAYKRDFLQASRHTQAVRKLSTQFPLLASSICLMKKWRDYHLLSNHINDELIELLTVRTFVHPGPYSIPSSPMAGFLRTLLFLSKWNWKAEPFIVNINGEMRVSDIEAIKTRFQAWRKLDPGMNKIALFAASNLDSSGITWTDEMPSKTVAAHFTGLARAAMDLVKKQGLDLQMRTLFVPSLADYDFIIHLDTKVAYRGQQQRARVSDFKNLQTKAAFDWNHVGFSPIHLLLEELRNLYGSNLVFFFNKDGGDVIAGLWHPLTGPRPWKVTSGFSTVPVEGEHEKLEEVVINKMGTLSDIARLGADLIDHIEMKR